MIHMKDRLLFKPQLSDFSALVLHHTVVLFLLTHSCGGQSQVIGTSQPIVAMVGDDIILPCHLDPAVDATDLTVEWARPDLDPRFVHLRRDGVELVLEEHPLYMGRTSLSINKLKCGDISLKISKVKLSDVGTYKCLVPKSGTESLVELAVGSVSSPDVEISIVSNGVLLDCKSKGWYPEPEVSWLDGEGNILSNGPTKTVRGPDGLYTVSSRVTVEQRHSNSFTCRVQQKNINQTRETQIRVPADLFMVQSSSAVRIIICLAVCFISIVAVVLVVWKWGQNKIKTKKRHEGETDVGERKTTFISSGELQLLMEGERDREQLMTGSEKMAYLDKTKAKLGEELQKNEGELQHVQEVITTLKKQKEHLKNQRETLTSLQQEDKTQIEENKKKLKETTVIAKDKKMKKREDIKQDLEKRKTEHEELLQNTKTLLETTEELIIRMTERKAKLERDKEQINKHLKETERQREEIQRKLQLEQSEREEERIDPSSNDPV